MTDMEKFGKLNSFGSFMKGSNNNIKKVNEYFYFDEPGFCEKYNLEQKDLHRTYSVDGGEPDTLINILNINVEAVHAKDIIDMVDNYIPEFKEIINLEIGETFEPGGAGGAPVKRIS
jgi:hypothetical protein